MKTREFKLNRRCFVLGMVLCATLVAFPGSKSLSQEDVSATVDCKELGRLQGLVQYQYDVTLTNNTKRKLKVNYTVILLAGDLRKKEHNHLTILTPSEKLIETNYGSMKESDWDLVTRFRVEWSSSTISGRR